MSNTVSIKALLLKEGVSKDDIIKYLQDTYQYEEVQFHESFQIANSIEFAALKKTNYKPPDWVNFLLPYLINREEFNNYKRFDFIAFIKYQKENSSYTFIFTSGSANHHIAKYIDFTFGISVLERVFDPEKNKIESVSEKGVIGDILASSRFYRRARSLSFEDDFGKYFQKINVRLDKEQIRTFFPNLILHKGNKVRDKITISGGSSIEIKTKSDFFSYILFLKDLAFLMELPPKPLFNQTLVPLKNNRDNLLITELKNEILKKIIVSHGDISSIQNSIDFCHRNFEDFYSSDIIKFTLPGIDDLDKDYSELEYEDIISSQKLEFLKSAEIESVLSSDLNLDVKINWLGSIQIESYSLEGASNTNGSLFDYLQGEIFLDGKSYFLLDNNWYLIKENFEVSLADKYKRRIVPKIENLNFAINWNGGDETAYNKLYDAKTNPFYLHIIKVDNIELCDILYIDINSKKCYIIHVKIGLDATVRDLSSQISISSRIIEQEILTGDFVKLKKLYEQAVKNNRINSTIVSESKFIDFFLKNERVYCIFIHPTAKLTLDQIKDSDFESRIAKFSLVELAALYNLNDWNLSINII